MLKEAKISKNSTGKAYIETFGCQMNEHDTERMLYHLEQIGYSSSEKRDDADIVIINEWSKYPQVWFKEIDSIQRLAFCRRI